MFKKALDVLFQKLSKDDLVKLHEEWDADAYNSFFHEFAERLNDIAPEEFIHA